MKTNEFIALIEEYYELKYSDTKIKFLTEYLEKEIKPEKLEKLFNRIIRTYSGNYKYLPDVAIFEKAKSEETKYQEWPVL